MRYEFADAGGFRVNEDTAQHDEELVRQGFWPKVRQVATKLPFAEDMLAGYYCAFDRGTPRQVRLALLGALAYFVMPFDAMPDMLPLFGFADDAAVLATVVRLVASNISTKHRAAARRVLDRMAR